jgi:hypothetical protein
MAYANRADLDGRRRVVAREGEVALLRSSNALNTGPVRRTRRSRAVREGPVNPARLPLYRRLTVPLVGCCQTWTAVQAAKEKAP